jgi:hypothetical protein
MAERLSAQISDNFSTAVPDPATAADAHPDNELMALIEKRFAAWTLSREVDEDIDAAYDEMDRVDALIAATPARTLDGVRLKAGIFHAIASDDVETAWPMLRSVLTDLQHVPLGDVAMLRSVFAELAASLPLRWTPDKAAGGQV